MAECAENSVTQAIFALLDASGRPFSRQEHIALTSSEHAAELRGVPLAMGGKSLLFNGHLDTNPVTEGWTVDPYAGLVDDKFIYGIGVSNMKAGDAAYFCAVKTLLEAGVKLKGDVTATVSNNGFSTSSSLQGCFKTNKWRCDRVNGSVSIDGGKLKVCAKVKGKKLCDKLTF